MLALFVLRILSPALVLVCLCSLLLLTAPHPHAEPSVITRVVVPTFIPRRSLILCLLAFSAFSFLLDGLAFVAYTIINKTWLHGTGVEYNAVLGLVAFAGLAALGAWKDIRGVDVWSMRRIKLAIATSSALDLALVILITKSIRLDGGGCEIPLIYSHALS
jgi:hypothetical protein